MAAMASERERERRERLGQVACGGLDGGLRWSRDSGSGHGGLVMAFMSTMVLGLKRREQTREKKTRERENEKGSESRIRDNIILIFNYTILLQYRPKNRMVL